MDKLSLIKLVLRVGTGVAGLALPSPVAMALNAASAAFGHVENALTDWSQASGKPVEQLMAELDAGLPALTIELQDWVADLERRKAQQ